MFPKSARLNRAAFTKCFASGQRKHAPYTTIILCGSPHFAVSVVVGKKVAKKAHERNQLRRQVYGLLKQYQATNPSMCGESIVVLKPAAAQLTKRLRAESVSVEIGRALNNR